VKTSELQHWVSKGSTSHMCFLVIPQHSHPQRATIKNTGKPPHPIPESLSEDTQPAHTDSYRGNIGHTVLILVRALLGFQTVPVALFPLTGVAIQGLCCRRREDTEDGDKMLLVLAGKITTFFLLTLECTRSSESDGSARPRPTLLCCPLTHLHPTHVLRPTPLCIHTLMMQGSRVQGPLQESTGLFQGLGLPSPVLGDTIM